jgi:hypothetical protein
VLVLYGLADERANGSAEVVEFYASREEADAALEGVLEDEPGWAGEVSVVAVEFPFSLN